MKPFLYRQKIKHQLMMRITVIPMIPILNRMNTRAIR